ncbi:DUF485 domain-containing protein [Pseudonocardia sp. ICBG1293]|uniref:DUF485 domain-containing protein n=1 Tax=Pseudonocardia sp. ICBG1293 TaxID=2844382 RepID=UPI001CC91501|nr:DUF485 domain-containing protein [Pseudonocardia sp. ICBG1293]
MSSDAPDWEALHRSAPFQQLVAERGRFVRYAGAALLVWFATFLAVIGGAPAVAGTVVAAGMTVGFLLGLSQFVVAWLLTWAYLRRSNRRWAPLEQRVRELAAAGAEPEAAR